MKKATQEELNRAILILEQKQKSLTKEIDLREDKIERLEIELNVYKKLRDKKEQDHV